MAKSGKFGGRPRARDPKPGDRVALGLRVTPEMKARLEQAAEEKGRSLSQETEFRLEQSLAGERALGGADVAQIAKMLAEGMKLAGELAAATGGQDGANGEWLKYPYAYDKAARTAVKMIEAMRPIGEIEPPKLTAENLLVGQSPRSEKAAALVGRIVKDFDWIMDGIAEGTAKRLKKERQK